MIWAPVIQIQNLPEEIASKLEWALLSIKLFVTIYSNPNCVRCLNPFDQHSKQPSLALDFDIPLLPLLPSRLFEWGSSVFATRSSPRKLSLACWDIRWWLRMPCTTSSNLRVLLLNISVVRKYLYDGDNDVSNTSLILHTIYNFNPLQGRNTYTEGTKMLQKISSIRRFRSSSLRKSVFDSDFPTNIYSSFSHGCFAVSSITLNITSSAM